MPELETALQELTEEEHFFDYFKRGFSLNQEGQALDNEAITIGDEIADNLELLGVGLETERLSNSVIRRHLGSMALLAHVRQFQAGIFEDKYDELEEEAKGIFVGRRVNVRPLPTAYLGNSRRLTTANISKHGVRNSTITALDLRCGFFKVEPTGISGLFLMDHEVRPIDLNTFEPQVEINFL